MGGAADGTVIGATKLVDHGPDAERFVMAILAEGFRADQQAAFEAAANAFVATLQAMKPFDELWTRINVYRVDIHSAESGADNPAICGSSGPPTGGATTARTYLDARFCGDGSIRRNLIVDQGIALVTANQLVPDYDVVVVVVNHKEFGGSGAPQIAVYSLSPDALETALHELGHSVGLADEYEYYAGCESGEMGHDTYTGIELGAPNITKVTNQADLKWRHLVDPTTPIPTTYNLDCTKCRPPGSPVPAGTVGLFVGAGTFHCGLYRPSEDCLMRTVGKGRPFCQVCQEAIKEVIGMDWHLTGNRVTNPAADFLGTTDNQPLVIKTNGVERTRIASDGAVTVGHLGHQRPGRLWPLPATSWSGRETTARSRSATSTARTGRAMRTTLSG